MKNVKIHNLSDVQSETIGPGTSIWQFVVILSDAQIGSYVMGLTGWQTGIKGELL